MRPSKYQQDIYDRFRSTTDNIVVGAVAGSGKTTVLKNLVKLTRGKSLFLAFNNSIVNELRERIDHPLVEISTLHSLGCKSIYRRWGKVKVVKGKTYSLIMKLSNIQQWEVDKEDRNRMFFVIEKMVDLYRLTLCTSIEEVCGVCDKLGIGWKREDLPYLQKVLEALNKINKRPKEIDFTDMIYLPATDPNYELPKVHNVFVDECQDLNKCQHALVDRLTKNARFVAVGDRYQAIYGFAGADTNSFSLFTQRPRTTEMPLSVCYRCPSRVIDQANKVYDILEMPEGVALGGVQANGHYIDAEPGDMIICRNLRPLIQAYFELLHCEKKCYIKGKDIGENLIRILKPYKKLAIEDLDEALDEELKELSDELRSRGIQKPQKHPSYQNLIEKIFAIRILAVGYDSVAEVINTIERIFKDEETEAIVLSTIHKAKGLEADNVYLLNRHLIPSQFAVTEEQLKQERNLLYVATTRAKKTLTYCKTTE